VTINDKAKSKPAGWKRGSFVVTVQRTVAESEGPSRDVLSFIGLTRPFTPLRECEVATAVLEGLE
jgi:hypothetical protein